MKEMELCRNLPEPELKLLYQCVVHVAEPLVVGHSYAGVRRIIDITGGSFAGPRLSGKVLAGGADWQVIRDDGITDLEAKYTLKTDDGALIYVINWGLRHGPEAVMNRLKAGEDVDPREYYFRCVPRFETGDERYAWLHGLVCVGTGARKADKVLLNMYSVH